MNRPDCHQRKSSASVVRNERGNMIALIVCVVAVILIPLIMFSNRIGLHASKSGRAQDAVEAAVKVAAMDLSRIVIEDPRFGYISLSNHQPVGRGTLAPDGEPLPVTGINTLVATLRQNAIIAKELHNDTMKDLVEDDHSALDQTIKALNSALSDAVNGYARKGECVDTEGNDVSPVEDVEKFLQENLPSNVKLESVKLSLGWLQEGSESTIDLPQPLKLAELKEREITSSKYEAFKNYPVDKLDFRFAGVDKQAHLVSSRKYMPADNKQISSIVKLQCTVSSVDDPDTKIECAACCQPYSHEDLSTHGVMTVRFSGRPVAGLGSWNEFLIAHSFQDNKLTNYEIIDGDYPYDKTARMKRTGSGVNEGTAQQFAEHLYYWLRNGRTRPRIDAVLAMLNDPFPSASKEVYIYEFTDDGNIRRSAMTGERFTRSVSADGQVTAMADTRIRTGASAIIFFRNNVKNLSIDGSKHGGAPLAGYPIGNSSENLNYEQLAQNFSKRNEFRHGLALDIEIGGTGFPSAHNDVISMRTRTRHRRI